MPDLASTLDPSDKPPCVCLIGAGTVGRAILLDHLAHEVDVLLIDSNPTSLETATEQATARFPAVRVQYAPPLVSDLASLRFTISPQPGPASPTLVIESVTEKLALKQSLFMTLRSTFGPKMILATNTSNLRVRDVFEPLRDDPNCCGLHFFMPVECRPLVECISTASTSSTTRNTCETHALRLKKNVLQVQDSPGFVVNRLLAPYLNQSLLILEHGVDTSNLAEAALAFGMPMPPLQLIDTIGIRTAFDSGRVFWQSFPTRLDPASILSGMLKAVKSQPNHEVRFCDPVLDQPEHEVSSPQTSNIAKKVIAQYQREPRSWTINEISEMISIPMWIEAAEVLKTQLVNDLDSVELAMRGGLGYSRPEGFFNFFDSMGSETLRHQLEHTGKLFRGLRASDELLSCLKMTSSPTKAILRYRELTKETER